MPQQPPPVPPAGQHERRRRRRAQPPPLSKTKTPAPKGFLEKTVMGEGRYSTLFKATSFELFVPKNRYTIGLGVLGTLAMAGVMKWILFDEDAGDPNRPEIIARKERMAALAEANDNLTDDGNWGQKRRSGW